MDQVGKDYLRAGFRLRLLSSLGCQSKLIHYPKIPSQYFIAYLYVVTLSGFTILL